MSNHTPGPWWVEKREGLTALQIQAKHRGEGSSYCVATVNLWESPEDNARLLAAAPEMLEALRPLANYLAILETMGGPSGGKGMNGDDHLWHVSSSAGDAVITFGDLQRARAAIAKAEGRS